MKRIFYLFLGLVAITLSGCAVGAGFQVGSENRCVGSGFHSKVERGNSEFVTATQVGKHKYRLDVSSQADFKKEN